MRRHHYSRIPLFFPSFLLTQNSECKIQETGKADPARPNRGARTAISGSTTSIPGSTRKDAAFNYGFARSTSTCSGPNPDSIGASNRCGDCFRVAQARNSGEFRAIAGRINPVNQSSLRANIDRGNRDHQHRLGRLRLLAGRDLTRSPTRIDSNSRSSVASLQPLAWGLAAPAGTASLAGELVK
jgi:hypothetical protein